MSGLAADLLLLGWLVASTIVPGVACCHWRTRLRGPELIGYGAAAGVVLQALFGIVLAFTRAARWPVVVLSIAMTLGAIFYLWRSGAARQLAASLSNGVRLGLAVWFLFAAACVAITYLPLRMPADLPDGRYIFKKDRVNVRLQFLTSLPADNYLPYVVTEYLLRRISFTEKRPLLPGQEISNRTILMSLIATPYRAALSPPPRVREPFPTFEYVGRRWPATGRLYREEFYRQFLVVGIYLNSLLLLGLIVVFANASKSALFLPAAALLYSSTPYLLAQTIFTWPKALAGFFLLLAWHAARRRFHPALVGVCAGLAYSSHPFALVFILGFVAFYALQWWRGRAALRPLGLFLVAVLAFMLPWLIWTKLLLGIPSDLVQQNFSAPLNHDGAILLNFVWVRLRNIVDLFTPLMLQVYPFDLLTVSDAALVCLPGAVGIFLLLPGLLEAGRAIRPPALLWCAIIVPHLFATAVFSYPSPTIVHGYQAAAGALLFLGLTWLRRKVAPTLFWSVFLLQLGWNIAFLAMRARLTGMHFG